MIITPTRIDIDIKIPTVITLSQIKNNTTIEEKKEAVNQIFTNISNVSFLVFPEISVSIELLEFLFTEKVKLLPQSCVMILGLEIINAQQFNNICVKYGIIASSNYSSNPSPPDTKLNVALVVFKKDDKFTIYPQIKIQHSKFEGSSYADESLFQSNELMTFSTNNVSFIVLICSDFFTRPTGQLYRIIDKLDFDVLKPTPVDFIFNIQHNRSPDHKLFIQSLARVYDDGYLHKQNICTIFLNSVFDNNEGGLSKILFFKEKQKFFKLNKSVKLVKAPVFGIETTQRETIVELIFDNLPKYWSDTDSFPCKIRNHQIGKEAHQLHGINVILPDEFDNILNYNSFEDLAKRLSETGHFDKAILWQEAAMRQYKCTDKYERGLGYKFIATQFRHVGRFNEALEYCSRAESEIRSFIHVQSNDIKFKKGQLFLWRIRAIQILINDYLIEGDLVKAIDEYERIIGEVNENIKKNLIDCDDVRIDLIHINRQIAEMKRINGDYETSRELFRNAYNSYEDYCIEEKAYSLLGEANSLRMLNDFANANVLYDKIEIIAKHHKFNRLLLSVTRFKCELFRTQSESELTNKYLSNLYDLSESFNVLFGYVYFWLIKGCVKLSDKEFDLASDYFDNAIKLCSPQIDYPAKLELGHAYFGKGEIARLLGHLEKANEFFDKAIDCYKGQCKWGIDCIDLSRQHLQDSCKSKEHNIMNIP